MEEQLPKRKPTRLKSFDYSKTGVYFVTLCTQNRKKILSKVVGVDVLGDPQSIELLAYGDVANKYINQLNEFYSNIRINQYVIMPNHIHILLFVRNDGSREFALRTRDVDPYKTNFYSIAFYIDVQTFLQQRVR